MIYKRFLTLLAACVLAQVFIPEPRAIVIAADTNTYQAAAPTDMPVYNPPDTEKEIYTLEDGASGTPIDLSEIHRLRRAMTDTNVDKDELSVYSMNTALGNDTIRGAFDDCNPIDQTTGAASNLHQYLKNRRAHKSGKRCGNQVPSNLHPLAPEYIGLASTDRPVFLFYVSERSSRPIEFTLNKAGCLEPEPIHETRVTDIEGRGIFQIDLSRAMDGSKKPIVLEPNVAYEWFLTIVLDEDERSADMVTSAVIKYVEPPKSMAEDLKLTPEDRHHFVYAKYGYWHCAIGYISRLIKAEPDNPELKKQRAFLLEHERVNLTEAAAFDLKG